MIEYKSPLAMLYHWEKTTPDKIYLQQPIDDVWNTRTWKQTADEVRRIAAYLKGLNLPSNSPIALVSKNCAHWILCDLAIFMAGHTSVPLYPNLQSNTLHQIMEHSEAKILFVGKLDDWNGMKAGVPEGVKCISFPYYNYEDYETWDSLIKKHQPLPGNPDRNADERSTIVYTSGTTGNPKGVVFNFSNFSFVAQHATTHLGFTNKDRFFSYLPLSHIAERLLVEMISVYVGGEVWFAESLQKFPSNLATAKPTVFLGVHRIWTKFQQGILSKLPQKKLDRMLSIPLLSSIVKKKIKGKLGLQEARMVITGAAPTPPSLINWFGRIGIKIQEAYAMTENCCYSHINLKNNIKIGAVGQPFPLCEVRLGDEQEIQMKHPALMIGYHKEPEMTNDAFTSDGFLKTGDEGSIDAEGFLKITGRVKDLFKTAKGKYVAPSPIEMKLAATDDIEQICVTGSGLPQPIALIVLSEQGRKKSREELGLSLKETVQQLNESLEPHEKVSKVIIMQDEWTVENNLLTPSFKIKRNEIEKKYARHYEDWEGSEGIITWQKH